MKLFVGVATASAALLIASVAFMLGVGAVHHWIRAVPPVGFDEAAGITVTGFVFLAMFGVAQVFSTPGDY